MSDRPTPRQKMVYNMVMVHRYVMPLALLLSGLLLSMDSASPEMSDTPGVHLDSDAAIASPCDELRTRVCGADNECAGQGWCEAAQLLAELDPTQERCREALASDTEYPLCTLDRPNLTSCDELINRVCGEVSGNPPARPCANDFACLNAQLLAADPDGGPTDARVRDERCRNAAAETTLYPPCPR
ncbi:MAG: hypothetical protein JXR83_14335 [Deltaproteobacteria bacterium]|nr:hypothetical protein [Deltaproteobacteria bacterium]